MLLALCLTASGCAVGGSAISANPNEAVLARDADTHTSAAEEQGDDSGEWRELDTDKDEEAVVAAAWLITGLAGIALSILGAMALF
ncbi:MAG: hypothetical protein GWN84_26485 [Gammaproteobacteria bacterium]|nr:hypothetical protein [Gammaproteobacteria bacterium]NIR85947.1 hypothetical protein [Gammaproteobacteria bacterium]NIR91939.1 hypothetical protein [Gammaproteobacteria bacterium]NIU07196.1 hypothetical protein [Gammaproteobacteria bacterium]NIV54009.1 hypothetical protein [Gammaproteobacteria bacterium]